MSLLSSLFALDPGFFTRRSLMGSMVACLGALASPRRWAAQADVEVAPHEPDTATSCPVVFLAAAARRSRSAGGSPAPALKISRSREKNRLANSGSDSSAGTSCAYPAGTLK